MSIVEADRLSSLFGRIYEAATDPSHWTGAVEQVAHVVGGCSAALVSRDADTLVVEIHGHVGITPHFLQLYRGKFAGIDPVLTGQVDVKIDQAISAVDVMPYPAFLETAFHREWGAPQGIVDTVAVVIEESGTRRTLLSILRHERDGLVDAMRERLRQVAPHIRRAWTIGRQTEASSRVVADLARTLDVLRTAICLLDGNGRVVHANEACRQLFADGDILTTVGDRIVARNTQAGRMLRDLLGRTERGEAASGFQDQIESLRSSEGSQYLARALVLTDERRHPTQAVQSATSALFVWEVSIAKLSASDAIASAFKLTPSELRVLSAIVEIGGVPEVAATLGIADTTVKTHLSRLFEKMAVGRQADLVKIVAGFSTPFARLNGDE